MTDEEVAKIEAEVMEWADAYMEAWTGDGDTGCENSVANIHPDHVVTLNGGKGLKQPEWLDYCKGVNANIAHFRGSWTDKNVRVLSSDAVVFFGRYESTWQRPDGEPFHRPANAQLFLLERTSTGWGMTLLENSNGPRAEG